MEIGVRVMKSDEKSITPEYVGHSYLTFVAINRRLDTEESRSNSSSVWKYLGWKEDSQPAKVVLPAVKPSSRLEARRHLLAGRRRRKRIEDAQRGDARDMVSLQVKQQVRKQVLDMIRERDDSSLEVAAPTGGEQSARMENRLRAVEIEFLIRAWAMQEDGVSVKHGRVSVDLAGDEPFDYSEHEIRSTARAMGVKLPGDEEYKAGRRLSMDFLDPSRLQGHITNPSSATEPRLPSLSQTKASLGVDTLTSTYALIFPEHTNSQGLIFGGNTMSWSEQVALMACRNIMISSNGVEKRGTWKTVAMDGLEFNVRVTVGE